MTVEEEWRPIAGYPHYLVSDQGRITSTRRGETRELRGGYVGGGYRKVTLVSPDGTRQARKVHHLVAEAFIGPRPIGAQVRHLDDNKARNAVDNLAYGSKSQNGLDAVRNGVHANAGKTHCSQRHPYDEANTYVTRRGKRMCRACMRDRSTRRTFAAAGIPA